MITKVLRRQTEPPATHSTDYERGTAILLYTVGPGLVRDKCKPYATCSRPLYLLELCSQGACERDEQHPHNDPLKSGYG